MQTIFDSDDCALPITHNCQHTVMSSVKAGSGMRLDERVFYGNPKGHQILPPKGQATSDQIPRPRAAKRPKQVIFFHNNLFSSFFLFFHQFSVFQLSSLQAAGWGLRVRWPVTGDRPVTFFSALLWVVLKFEALQWWVMWCQLTVNCDLTNWGLLW